MHGETPYQITRRVYLQEWKMKEPVQLACHINVPHAPDLKNRMANNDGVEA